MLDAYPPEVRDFVTQKIAAGEFKTADEFAVQAAKVYLEMDRRHQELKDSVAAAIADLDAGNGAELDGEQSLHEFFEDIKRQGRRQLAQTRSPV